MAHEDRFHILMLDPVGEVKVDKIRLAPRVIDIKGTAVGFLFNGHPGWKSLWDNLQSSFATQYQPSGQVRKDKRNLSAPAPDSTIEEMADSVQAAVVGVGA